jgi:hypothetical protein
MPLRVLHSPISNKPAPDLRLIINSFE